jgi:NADPH-dependent 2,4-dienoyl-CoA reductase/sulfur reductase-like enzyme
MTLSVVVVGAGLAGLRVCETLRREGYADELVLIGDEPHPPYTRPPLSKEVLGGSDPLVTHLRSESALAELGIDLRLESSADGLDLATGSVQLADGRSVRFKKLVIATGARARQLPGVTDERVLTLRTLDDSLALRERLRPDSRVVVVGAGFIGLEAAAAAAQLGCDVTVVDVLATPLARVLDPAVGEAVRRLHETNGVRFRLGVGVAAVEGSAADVVVAFSDGSIERATTVIVGIGVVPATGWLHDSGLTVGDGVVCCPSLRAAEQVWAVGDVARWTPPTRTASVRIEHWTVAAEMAEHVGRNIATDTDTPFGTVPYVWSDQFGAKLQSVGFTTTGDEVKVVSGSLDEPQWAVLVRDGDRLGGAIGMRAARQVIRARALLSAHASWSEAVELYDGGAT